MPVLGFRKNASIEESTTRIHHLINALCSSLAVQGYSRLYIWEASQGNTTVSGKINWQYEATRDYAMLNPVGSERDLDPLSGFQPRY